MKYSVSSPSNSLFSIVNEKFHKISTLLSIFFIIRRLVTATAAVGCCNNCSLCVLKFMWGNNLWRTFICTRLTFIVNWNFHRLHTRCLQPFYSSSLHFFFKVRKVERMRAPTMSNVKSFSVIAKLCNVLHSQILKKRSCKATSRRETCNFLFAHFTWYAVTLSLPHCDYEKSKSKVEFRLWNYFHVISLKGRRVTTQKSKQNIYRVMWAKDDDERKRNFIAIRMN